MTVASFGLALVLTWLIEAAVLVLCVRASLSRVVSVSLAVNALTNPLANWAYHGLDVSFGLVEALVFAAEVPLFLWLFDLSLGRAIATSLLVNGVTVAISFLA